MGMLNALKRKKRPGLCCLQPCPHSDRHGGFSLSLNSCHACTSLCQKCPRRLWTAFEVGITCTRHRDTREVGTASPAICTRTAFPGKNNGIWLTRDQMKTNFTLLPSSELNHSSTAGESFLEEKKICFFWIFWASKNYQSLEVSFSHTRWQLYHEETPVTAFPLFF